MLKLQLNWGRKIAILYSSFVIFMLGLAYMASGQKQELVSGDYYARELRFQEELNMKKLTQNLPVQPTWKVSDGNIAFTFPADMAAKGIKSTIILYKASNSKLDKAFEADIPADGKYTLPTQKVQPGIYKLILNWSAAGAEYRNEGNINI